MERDPKKPEATDPKFRRGEVVRHRASGDRAIVVDVNPPAPPSGSWSYNLDAGFYAEFLVRVPEWALEAGTEPFSDGLGGVDE